ncbi:MAG TPA: GLUG motif-containing protein, partial [Candidatus Nanoarchaeia archaeon]|nr:GLUG motif-containing protein [Candidatus Nanoarchaeia archaeon]
PRGNDGCQADCQDICYPASWGCLSNADCCSGLSCSNGVCAAGGGGINTESCSYTTSFDGGDGNDPNASPYLISNCIQLQWICNEPTKFYKLAANVDCSGTASWNSGRGFDPIAGFDGSLNGNGFVISDLTINRPTTDEVGVFKRTLATSDTIWNVGLSNVSVVGRNYVGALVGRGAKYILRTYVTGSVSGESYVGGLAGEVIYSLSDSYSKATVTASVQIAGGLAGSLAGGSIERSYATGNVTAPAEAGGLIGYVDVPSVTGAFDSFATGNVSGAGTKGAVFGNSDDSVTTNVHWHDHAGNPDTCCDSGDSCSLNCAPQISVNYFYNSSNSPMNAWLFGVGGWQSGSTFPCLAWESSC